MSNRKRLSENQDAFLKGKKPKSSDQPAPESTTPETDMTKAINNIFKPKSDESAQQRRIRLTVDLDRALHKRLAIAATTSGKSQSEIVRELLDVALPPMTE